MVENPAKTVEKLNRMLKNQRHLRSERGGGIESVFRYERQRSRSRGEHRGGMKGRFESRGRVRSVRENRQTARGSVFYRPFFLRSANQGDFFRIRGKYERRVPRNRRRHERYVIRGEILRMKRLGRRKQIVRTSNRFREGRGESNERPLRKNTTRNAWNPLGKNGSTPATSPRAKGKNLPFFRPRKRASKRFPAKRSHLPRG